MGKAIELLSGLVTAPSTTQTALTMATGNSLTIRNAVDGSNIYLLAAWTDNQTAGTFRIRSPQMHDNVQGLRFSALASSVLPIFPVSKLQKLVPQDTLTVDLSGSGTGGDIEQACLLVMYEDLPGINGQFITAADVDSQIVDMVTVENTLALGTAGGYSGEEAINAEFDLLHANTNYAILGYVVNSECCAIRYRSSDFGNLGLGGPGADTHPDITSGWFYEMSKTIDAPTIPVFSSANVASVLLDGVTDENGTDVLVSTILAQLAG